MTALDLSTQSIEDAAGKIIEIGGAEYELLEIVAEGGFKLVYSTRSLRSGLVEWAAKLYKSTPGSEVVSGALKSRQMLFASWAVTGEGLFLADPGELHVFGGCAIEFTPLMSVVPGHAHGDIAEPREKWRSDDLQGAIEGYQAVLQENPAHALALSDLGALVLENGGVPDAIRIIESALELEPNRRGDYLNLATAYEIAGHFDKVLQTLGRTLDQRYRLDHEAWRRKARLAVGCGWVAVLEGMLNEVSGAPVFEPLAAHLSSCLEDAKELARNVESARDLQEQCRYRDALAHWEKAAPMRNFSLQDHLDLTTCLLRAEDERAASASLEGMKAARYSHAEEYMGLVALVCSAEAEDSELVEQAVHIAKVLEERNSHPFDLPGWPRAVGGITRDDGTPVEGAVLVDGDHGPILRALRALSARAPHEDGVATLLARYEEKQRLMSDAAE